MSKLADGTFEWMTACTAYLQMNGESTYVKAMKVTKFKVYDKYFKDPSVTSPYDYAIASVEISQDELSLKALKSQLGKQSSSFPSLDQGCKIRVTTCFIL